MSSLGLFALGTVVSGLCFAKAVTVLVRRIEYIYSYWDGGYFRAGRILSRRGIYFATAQWAILTGLNIGILFGWLSLLGPAPLILLVTGILGWIVTWPGSVFDPRRVRRGPGSLVMVLAAGAVMMAVLGHLFPAEGQYDEYPLTPAEKQSGPAGVVIGSLIGGFIDTVVWTVALVPGPAVLFLVIDAEAVGMRFGREHKRR